LGGDCYPLPNPEEEDMITTQSLLDLCPGERITIQNKCYDVKGLYRWIITDDRSILPTTQTEITEEEKNRLKQAYEELCKIQNILTRDKLIQIYPNLLNLRFLDLNNKHQRCLWHQRCLLLQRCLCQIQELQPGIFDNLRALEELHLHDNYIQSLQIGTFNNLPALGSLLLCNNQIKKLQSGVFNNLPGLRNLNLSFNQIRELQPNTFNNLPALGYLHLNNNQIIVLRPNTFNNLPNLFILNLQDNHRRCLWQIRKLQPGIFDNLLNL
jgi:Leucine-rich repeat (LRR) protein